MKQVSFESKADEVSDEKFHKEVSMKKKQTAFSFLLFYVSSAVLASRGTCKLKVIMPFRKKDNAL